MKLHQEQREVIRSNVGRESTFRIAASAQAFDILSSKLYTDPRLAIVRELSTNAYDAMVEAGTQDKPFKVHLPNDFAAFFSIRDYGTGLSPEAVESVYSTYFASTRNDSNDYTGALGLGSKSPFSYTDQFTVTSYYRGVAYNYSAFKSEKGEPSIALLSQSPTTEPNGLEIKINVKAGDAWEFERAAKKVYRFFPVRPEISGRKIEFPVIEPVFYGSEYALFKGTYSDVGVSDRINVIMGNVCYGVSDEHITSKLGQDGTLVLFMPIGGCQVAASREELHYDPATIASLQKKVNEAFSDIEKNINAELKKCVTLMDRMVQIGEYRSVIDVSFGTIMIGTQKDGIYNMRRIDVRSNKLQCGLDRYNDTLNPNYGYCFVENDVGELTQKMKNRLRYWIICDKSGKKNNSAIKHEIYYLANILDRAGFEEVFGANIVQLSKLPDPPRNTTTNGVSTSFRSFVHKCQNTRNRSLAWTSIKPDVKLIDVKDTIAVPRRGNVVVWQGKDMEPRLALEIANFMGYSNLLGISERHFDRICDELGLESMETEAEAFTKKTVSSMTASDIALFKYGWSDYDFPNKLLQAISGLSDTCKAVADIAKAKIFSPQLGNLMVYFGMTFPKTADPREAFKKRYPLVSQINMSYAQISDVVEYIQLREAKLGQQPQVTANP